MRGKNGTPGTAVDWNKNNDDTKSNNTKTRKTHAPNTNAKANTNARKTIKLFFFTVSPEDIERKKKKKKR